VDVGGIGEQPVLDRVRQELADRGGVHARQFQAREEHARGGKRDLEIALARDARARRRVRAQQRAARIEEHPRERRGRVDAVCGGKEDAELHDVK